MLRLPFLNASIRLISHKNKSGYFRVFSNKLNKAPEEFFDDNTEAEKLFLDLAASVSTGGGVEKLTLLKKNVTWDIIDPSSDNNIDVSLDKSAISKKEMMIASDAVRPLDMARHITDMDDDSPFLPQAYLNYNINWETQNEDDEQEFEDDFDIASHFIEDTNPQKYSIDMQGDKHCVGGQQRRGMSPHFGCHLVDLDELNYLDVMTLKNFLSDDSEILSKKMTGLCSQCQKKVAKTVKRARHFGILPHLGDYQIRDTRMVAPGQKFHDSVTGKPLFESKTIL